MKISNIRLGFATNSSSSHSIVILPPGVRPPNASRAYACGAYGWENFVLSDQEDKMAYLGTLVGSSLNALYGEDIAMAVMAEWFSGLQWQSDWYVDHQSHIEMPLDSSTGQISKAFVADFKRFMERSDVHILGGNDNDCSSYLDEFRQYRVDATSDLKEGYHSWGRKSYDWWTLFTPETGAKLRFSFENNPAELTRSTAPELVDMKITDYCPFGCSFCYQASTPAGKHASFEDVRRYLDAMHGTGVFEVALGGGEPTLHPDFIEILQHAREIGLVPNFTTKVLPDKWSTKLRDAVNQYAGSFAVSASDSVGVEKVAAYVKLYNPDVRPAIHYVVGAQYGRSLQQVIEVCARHYLPLTLLGYKSVGRGKDAKSFAEIVTPEVLKSARRLSVDTAFLEQYGDVLDQAGVPAVLRVPGEGNFSMYIDAVSHKAGKSSYHVDALFDFEPPWGDQLFEAWHKVGGDAA